MVVVSCSNRTFMELKLSTTEEKNMARKRSNRTFMELKSSISPLFSPLLSCSNRTFMELKYLCCEKVAV